MSGTDDGPGPAGTGRVKIIMWSWQGNGDP